MAPRGYTILIIDDNSELTAVLSQELQEEGYQVYTAANGEEGLSMLDKYQIGLVILDIRLPGIGGFDVLQIIKMKFPEIKVVMITAHSDVYHAMESRRFGANDFIGKPYDLGELLTAIERLRVG